MKLKLERLVNLQEENARLREEVALLQKEIEVLQMSEEVLLEKLRRKPCTECNGSGLDPLEDMRTFTECPICAGKGYLQEVVKDKP